MGYVKLTEPGTSHTMRVKSVSVNTSGSWPEWEFTDGTDTLAVPQKAMERQLARLEMASALEMAGSTVRFSRSEKLGANKRPFWDVEIVNAAAATPKASPRVKPAEADPSVGIPDHHKLHPADRKPLPFDEDPNAHAQDDEDIFPHETFSQPPLTPREQAEAVGRGLRETEYLALMTRVAKHMCEIGARHEIAIDGSAIQAATFSLWGITGRPK